MLDSFDKMKHELDDYTDDKLQKIYEKGLINKDRYAIDDPNLLKKNWM